MLAYSKAVAELRAQPSSPPGPYFFFYCLNWSETSREGQHDSKRAPASATWNLPKKHAKWSSLFVLTGQNRRGRCNNFKKAISFAWRQQQFQLFFLFEVSELERSQAISTVGWKRAAIFCGKPTLFWVFCLFNSCVENKTPELARIAQLCSPAGTKSLGLPGLRWGCACSGAGMSAVEQPALAALQEELIHCHLSLLRCLCWTPQPGNPAMKPSCSLPFIIVIAGVV